MPTFAMNKKTELLVVLAILIGCLLVVAKASLLNPQLGGLDEAHHVMDGIFFHDLFTDLPFSELKSYPYNYYKQYPALGFLFWPPFFPAIEGIVFMVSGIDLLSAQISILLFAILLSACFYLILRKQMPLLPALAGTVLLISTPGLYQYFNVVMLEVPTLAMMALTLLIYSNITDASPNARRWWHWQLLAVVAAMSLYTKQTAFILFPAILLDLLLNHRSLLKEKAAWLGLLSATVLTVPLALFTLKFGKANLGQSIGNNTQLIMSGYAGPTRWSIESWTFYLTALPNLFTMLVLFFAAIFIIHCLLDRALLRRNTLYITWLISFYLFFSYFDNKFDRFATLISIPLTILAARGIWQTIRISPSIPAFTPYIVFALIIANAAWLLQDKKVQTMHGTDEIMRNFDISKIDGNFAYWGDYRQVFVYHIREQDRDRSHHILQADDIFGGNESVVDVLRDYRIRYLFIEPGNLSEKDRSIVAQIEHSDDVSRTYTGRFSSGTKTHDFIALRNDGKLSEKMRDVSLTSTLIDSNTP